MMKCFVFRSRQDVSQNVNMRSERIQFGGGSLCAVFYLVLQFSTRQQEIILRSFCVPPRTTSLCFSLFYVSYDSLPDSTTGVSDGYVGDDWLQTLSLPIGVKERLVEDDSAGELICMLCITALSKSGHNNSPLLGASYPKS